MDSGQGGQPRRGRKGWGCQSRSLPLPGELGQAHPASLSCALARPAHTGLWALSSGLPLGHWCPVLEAQPQESACWEPRGVSPGAGRAGVLGGQHRKKQAPGLRFNSSPGKWRQCPCCEGFQRTTTTKHSTHIHCVRAGARAGARKSQASGWAALAAPADSCSPAGRLCGSPEASTTDPNVTPHVAGSQLPSSGAADTKATKPALTGANTSSS